MGESGAGVGLFRPESEHIGSAERQGQVESVSSRDLV
jgi:hypothetical protein